MATIWSQPNVFKPQNSLGMLGIIAAIPNGHRGMSNYGQHDCLSNSLIMLQKWHQLCALSSLGLNKFAHYISP